MKKEIDLTTSTIGQFKVGDPYEEKGKVVKVELTSMVVEYPDEKNNTSSDIRTVDGVSSGAIGMEI